MYFVGGTVQVHIVYCLIIYCLSMLHIVSVALASYIYC